MKKICQIAVLLVVLCALASSCASSRKQVPCPAYGSKSGNFERLPY
ncbi:MAG: hypothetical protein FWG79_05455 [Bacteroidales bacterium]|nr:hypothetical protein [Bacteroidales bacterium]